MKKFTALLLSCVIACAAWSCSGQEAESPAQTEATVQTAENTEPETAAETGTENTAQTTETAEAPTKSIGKTESIEKENTATASGETARPPQTASGDGETEEQALSRPESGFSYADLAGRQFTFSSGAGAWSTVMYIRADGSFSGEYHDSDMGSVGPGYPGGTMYQCVFTGQLGEPEQINDYTYSAPISSLRYEEKAGQSKIIGDVLYSYSGAYGLEGTDHLLIYLPQAPLSDLPEEFISWTVFYMPSDSPEGTLSFYGLYNEPQQTGFSSYDLAESLEESLSYAEEQAAALNDSLEQETLTQDAYNETSQELYDLWDSLLNRIWSALQNTLDEESMAALTEEERQWISEKEAAVSEAGAPYEGGPLQPMMENLAAAQMTRDRVYVLMERLAEQ